MVLRELFCLVGLNDFGKLTFFLFFPNLGDYIDKLSNFP